jgi:hypothetical protein
LKLKYVKYLEEQLGIERELEWNNVASTELQNLRLPPKWRLFDVLSLVREVYNSPDIMKSKTNSYKKTQFVLQSMLKSIFPREGTFIEIIFYI